MSAGPLCGMHLGVDLHRGHAEVRALALAAVGGRRTIEALGIAADDHVQDVYLRILAANRRPAAYDPQRSRVSVYVSVVSRSVLRDALRRRSRRPVEVPTDLWGVEGVEFEGGGGRGGVKPIDPPGAPILSTFARELI